MAVTNNRPQLPDGFGLTETIQIKKLLGEGGSSLVYLAEEAHAFCVIKEIFPLQSTVKLMRNQEGRVIIEAATEAAVECQRVQLQSLVERERRLACYVGKKEESNTIFSFPASDITENVRKNPELKGTEAHYLKSPTVDGLPLPEYVDELLEQENQETLTLEQVLILTWDILEALQQCHTKPALHLDIKPQNLFFIKERALEKTYCVLLDYGSGVAGTELKETETVSLSPGYAPYEQQKLFRYIKNGYRRNAQKYRKLIGKHTDLASVGMVFYRLLCKTEAGQKLKPGQEDLSWYTSQTDLENHLKEVLPILLKEYPYLENRVFHLLSKAVFIPDSAKRDIQEGRFSDCCEFMKEIELLQEILQGRGAHPEVLAEASRRQFQQMEEQGKLDFKPDWFPPAKQIKNDR